MLYVLGAAMNPLKRSAASDSDSENVDPMAFKPQLIKRKRVLEEDDLVKESSKAQKIVHTALAAAKSSISNESLVLQTFSPKVTTPMSCPSVKPAGRSPKSKPCKAFGRRSVGSTTRFEPISKRGVHRAPFSLATALTPSSRKAKTRAHNKDASWFFPIHVDTEQEEMTNLMQHSTTTLDISDDEGKGKMDGRGKENIPPHELGIVMTQPQQQIAAVEPMQTRKNMMTEDPRSALGELATSDYYGTGCNAMSFAVVYDDEPEVVKEKLALTPNLDFAVVATAPSFDASAVSSVIETSPIEDNASVGGEKATEPTEAEIEIWESGSAAEEATQAIVDYVEVTSIFASA
jgi:hypothetical protein